MPFSISILKFLNLSNDLAILEAYGFDKNFSETEIIAELIKKCTETNGRPHIS